MSAVTQTKTERINLRLKSSAKSLLERAASFEGKTVSHFILNSALERAEKTVQKHEVMILNAKDSQTFFNALSKPVGFNRKLTHARLNFQCGVDALDRYLKKQAGQDIKRCISRVFIATEPDNPRKVIGYYSLSSLSIELSQLPKNLSRKFPKYPVPSALIGRLAVSQAAQGKGVGKILLADAIKRTLAVSDEIAIYAIVVDAINSEAQRFYERFGFTCIGNENKRLFLTLQPIEPNKFFF